MCLLYERLFRLIKGANEHIPESKILKQFIEYAENKELQEQGDAK